MTTNNYNTKCNQKQPEVSTFCNLTEQWEKGELESGWYYVNYYSIDGAVMQEYLPQHNGFGYDEKNLVQEVLAPVPSYEEYSRLEWYAGCGPDRIVELNKENRQLRKFLEEFNAIDVAEENEALKTKLSIQCEANEELRKENQQLRKWCEEFNALDVAKENKELKELLKECRVYVENCEQFNAYDFEMLKTIDNAIGEKK